MMHQNISGQGQMYTAGAYIQNRCRYTPYDDIIRCTQADKKHSAVPFFRNKQSCALGYDNLYERRKQVN